MLLSQLEYFRVVAKHEHISHAAEELCIAQPALSTTISKLEKELGVPLFNRTGRNIELNDAGRRLLAHADYLFGQIDTMHHALEQTKEILENEVIISVSNSLFLVNWLQGFVLNNPKIRLRQRVLSENQMLEALRNETIDIAFGVFNQDIPGIVRKVIVEDEYVFTVSDTHPLAQKKTIVFDDIKNENVVGLPSNTIQKIADRVYAQKNCKPNIVFEGNHGMIGKMMQENKGILFATRQMLYMLYCTSRKEKALGVFDYNIAHTIADLDCNCALALCWKEGRELPVMANKFIEAMEDSFTCYQDDEDYMRRYILRSDEGAKQ